MARRRNSFLDRIEDDFLDNLSEDRGYEDPFRSDPLEEEYERKYRDQKEEGFLPPKHEFELRFRGDEHRANELKWFGIKQLHILRGLMGFQGVKHDVRRIFLDDGSIIECQSVYGHDIVTILAAPEPRGRREKKRYVPTDKLRGIFRRTSDNKIFTFQYTGTPYDGDLAFVNSFEWGSGLHVWYILDTGSGEHEYWRINASGQIRYNRKAGILIMAEDGEDICSGVSANANCLNVRKASGTYTMQVSYDDGSVKDYTSSDGKTWTLNSTITFAGNTRYDSGIDGSPLLGVSTTFYDFDTNLIFVEHVEGADEGNPGGYPSAYFRLYRVGIKSKYGTTGVLNTTESAWTEIADSASLVQYTFAEENDFTVEGGHAGLQFIQLLSGYPFELLDQVFVWEFPVGE
jgi:hypothetical protein